MARIRSVHPDLFTDENFVELSPAAQVLLIGLGTLADDQGVFQWKPAGIRLKIFPGSLHDVQELLSDLREHGWIKQFTSGDGRAFGAIRGFCSHQKPKRPNAKFPLPIDLYDFVKLHENSTLASECSEHVGNQYGTCSPGEERRGEERRGEEDLVTNVTCASDDAQKLKPEHLMQEWNEHVSAHTALPKVRDLTPARRDLCRHRIAQYPLEDFVTVFGKIRASPFLRGDLKWKGATFDWALKRQNFQKILEGNYDD